MLPEPYRWIAAQFEPEEGDPWLLLEIAQSLENDGDLPSAATVYDRAFGIAPNIAEIRERRRAVLDRLAVVEHGLVFRYVPGGPFLMGSNHGEADEKPWHPVWLTPYWMTETPISWAAYCRLMDWETPEEGGFPRGAANEEGVDERRFHLSIESKIRWQYCQEKTLDEEDAGKAPPNYDLKPMVAVSWQEAMELADRLASPTVHYSLPTEAQWEKAARGGLIGARHAWGNAPPARECCDFDRLWECSILPMTAFAANGYGLYAVNGCVWEWTRDWYDREYYRHAPDTDPQGPSEGEEKVLRGGSWTDCADVVTVTFRMSRGSRSWRDGKWGQHLTPTIGFRLCRTAGV
ncbi:MAG TPA: SUMF1/EgtB/PvdO family nonheme iron enzyme [Gemmataceae bacterium]|jgi:formylglycine-generating enzyme required for sulfatase activity